MKYQMTSLWEDDTRPEPRFYNNVEQRPVRKKPENFREKTQTLASVGSPKHG